MDYEQKKAAFERELRPLVDKAYEHLSRLSDKTTRGDMARGGHEILDAFVRVDALATVAAAMANALRDTDPDFHAGYEAAARVLARPEGE